LRSGREHIESRILPVELAAGMTEL